MQFKDFSLVVQENKQGKIITPVGTRRARLYDWRY